MTGLKPEKPVAAIVAGPNGAGKSTLYHQRIAPALKVPFINADEIQRTELDDDSPEAAYEAAEIAACRRQVQIEKLQSFATETVFSHESKLALVKQLRATGFHVFLFHVGVDSPDLSVARVGARVAEGGHTVPEEKIRSRFDRNGPIIRKAVLLSNSAEIFDNSALNQPPRNVLSFVEGKLVQFSAPIPNWIAETYDAELT